MKGANNQNKTFLQDLDAKQCQRNRSLHLYCVMSTRAKPSVTDANHFCPENFEIVS